MKIESFLKVRLGFMLFGFLWMMFGTVAIPLLTVAAFQRATSLLEFAFFPLFAIGFACCAIGGVLLVPFIRDDILSLLNLNAR